MARAVVASPDRVVCVVGVAGAGKTTAVHAVASAFRAAGTRVLGAAPSGIAAERLRDETGISAMTLHRLLDCELPDRCVLGVDEAGMAETRVLAPILERVEQAGGKAILIGDTNQLPAVGGRPLRRHRRAGRCDRAHREPPPARPRRAPCTRGDPPR
jgi:ATP-dependent exoDNAse (exonuclease V) alpha subunit